MSLCWFMSLLVIVSVAPFAVAVVTLLQQGDALLAAALMVVFLVSVIAILMRLLKNPPEEEFGVDHSGEGLSVSLAAAESPPAYEVVIKSPPPYMSYPGHGGVAYTVPAVYYCYCGSTNAATAASSCKLCSDRTHVPYITHITQEHISCTDGRICHTDGNQASEDPFLPSYSEAVKVYTIDREESTHL